MKNLIELVQLKPRTLFGIGSVGIILLFTPDKFISTLGLFEFRNNWRSLIGLMTVIGVVFWIVQLFPVMMAFLAESKHKKMAIKSLDSLASYELTILLYGLWNNQRTVFLSLGDCGALALCQKGILLKASGTGHRLGWPYTIENFIWEHLRQNPRYTMPKLANEQPAWDWIKIEEYAKTICMR